MSSYGKQQPTYVNNSSSSGGVGFTGLLFLVFLVLKLTHVINWSWWWVTVPLWGGLALAIAVAIVVGVVAFIAALVSRK